MSTKTLFCTLCLLLVCGTTLPAKIDAIKRVAREIRDIRQSPTVSSACSVASDCHSSEFNNVPMDFVNCQNMRCECKQCFMYDPGQGKCFNCSDYLYFDVNGTCGVDNRQDQRRAFFLSLFFSSTGAANFYIKSYGLAYSKVSGSAVGQLIVLIVFIISVIVVICPCCICCGCVNKEGAIKGTCLFILLFILSVAFVFIMGALIVSWWIGDLSVFAGNERRTGSGCFPQSNL